MSSARELVLIYQMGKVASSTIKASILPLPRYEVHQVHRLVPSNIERVYREHRRRGWPMPTGDPGGIYLQRDLHARRPAKVITLVREPIGRNISYYFQNLDKILGRSHAHELPLQAVIDGYPPEFPYSDDPLTWFDYEFNAALGANVYESGWAPGMNAHRWRAGVYDILILRCDAADDTKREALREFLDAPALSLRQANVTSAKPSAAMHRAFRQNVRFPAAYVDRMLGSRYANFFFDAASLAQWRRAYTESGSMTPRLLKT
ncbi:MAG: hypothetical protein J0L81_16455 [Caulobacterales bacterium]|jgi:hypothetical protein|nr:hypothetical protein [Caulobacterales bacterium]